MNYWIFQATQQKYDLREKIIENQIDTWFATRYLNLMKPDDLVFFWQAGDETVRGVYGWGKIKSLPYIEDTWNKHGIDVIYKKIIQPHLSVNEIKSNPLLQDMLILRTAQATNFLLSSEEARALRELIKPGQQPEEI